MLVVDNKMVLKNALTCHHKLKFVLTFVKYDLTLVEICTIELHFGPDTCQIKLEFERPTPKVLRKMLDIQM